MDITGKIIFASEPRTGTSKTTGNPWITQDFVIETQEQYPKKCVFTVFGKERLEQMNLQVNGEYTVSFDIDAHEFNGRWFNDIRAWRAVPAQLGMSPVQGSATPASAYAPQTNTLQPSQQPNSGSLDALDGESELPF